MLEFYFYNVRISLSISLLQFDIPWKPKKIIVKVEFMKKFFATDSDVTCIRS